MKFRHYFSKSATRDDRALDELADSLVEASFRRNLLTRLVRTVGIIFVSFIASTAFVQTSERKACNNAKVFMKSYSVFVSTAANARERDANNDNATPSEKRDNKETAEAYRQQVKLMIQPAVERDCTKDYPIIPFLGV